MKAKILVSATTADKKTENLFDILSLLGEPYFVNLQDNNTNAIKNYLRQNKYSSLLDMVSVVVSLTTTKDMLELFFGSGSFHLMRWSLPYNGSPVDFVTRDIKLADPSNTQSSRPFNQAEWGEILLNNEWKEMQYRTVKESKKYYDQAIMNGLSQKEAESLLPVGLTEDILYINGSLKSWIRFVSEYSSQVLTAEEQNVVTMIKNALIEYEPFLQELLR
jgi:hypothetical protein